MTELNTIDFKGKPYVTVNERLKFFRENYKDHSLQTTVIKMEDGMVLIKAVIIRYENGNPIILATGHAYEKEGSSFINKTSYIENCETSAWGRALANFGIGIDAAVSSYDEVGNAVEQQNDEPEISDKTKKEMIESKAAIKSRFKKLADKLGSNTLAYKEIKKNKSQIAEILESNDASRLTLLATSLKWKLEKLED